MNGKARKVHALKAGIIIVECLGGGAPWARARVASFNDIIDTVRQLFTFLFPVSYFEMMCRC